MKKNTLSSSPPPLTDIEIGTANDIHKYILENYNKKISRDHLCKKFGVNKNFFSACFTRVFKKSFVQVLTEKRMEVAVIELQAGMPVKIISSELGYNSLRSFDRAFKKFYKCSPNEYRKKK